MDLARWSSSMKDATWWRSSGNILTRSGFILWWPERNRAYGVEPKILGVHHRESARKPDAEGERAEEGSEIEGQRCGQKHPPSPGNRINAAGDDGCDCREDRQRIAPPLRAH